MSYYATVEGMITFKNFISEEKVWEVRKYLSQNNMSGDVEVRQGGIEFYGCYHYYDEAKIDGLLALAEVGEATLDFVGEDDSRWQFVFTPDKDHENGGYWTENVCDSTFHSPSAPGYNKLKEMFISYVTADSEESGDPGYIIRKLEQCGCKEAYRKELGLDFPEQEA